MLCVMRICMCLLLCVFVFVVVVCVCVCCCVCMCLLLCVCMCLLLLCVCVCCCCVYVFLLLIKYNMTQQKMGYLLCMFINNKRTNTQRYDSLCIISRVAASVQKLSCSCQNDTIAFVYAYHKYYWAYVFNDTPSRLLWEAFRHTVITAQNISLLTHPPHLLRGNTIAKRL